MKVRYFIAWGCVHFSQVSFRIISPGGSLGGVFRLPGALSWGMSRQGVQASRRSLLGYVSAGCSGFPALSPVGYVSAGCSGFPALSPGECLGRVSEDRGPSRSIWWIYPLTFLAFVRPWSPSRVLLGKVSAGGRRIVALSPGEGLGRVWPAQQGRVEDLGRQIWLPSSSTRFRSTRPAQKPTFWQAAVSP
jgi:hypothetical protein